MSVTTNQLRLEFAHGLPRIPGAPQAGDEEAPQLPEAFARARLVQLGPDGELLSMRRWPAVATLADVTSTWRWEPLPEFLEGLLGDRDLDLGGQLEVLAPAEIQDTLRRRAPRTWQLLIQRTRLVHRGEAFVLDRRGHDLRVTHLTDGADGAVELRSPLLSLATRLAEDGLLAAEARGEAWERAGRREVRRLLSELLRARWLHRRLPPGVRWNADEGTFDLRHSETRPRVREDFGDAVDGIPRRMFLQCEAISSQLDLECEPGEDLPLPVVRAGLEWLLNPARAEASLVLTPAGRFPREG